jgi:hypothetical protein
MNTFDSIGFNFDMLCHTYMLRNYKSAFMVLFIGCSFKFILTVGVEESIVKAPLVSLQSKNTNDANIEVRFKQLIPWSVFRGHSRLFNSYFKDKFKWTSDTYISFTIVSNSDYLWKSDILVGSFALWQCGSLVNG